VLCDRGAIDDSRPSKEEFDLNIGSPEWLGIICTIASLVNVTGVHGDGPSGTDAATTDGNTLSVEVARDRAFVMHNIYAATLDVLHHRYFHRDRAIIPARVMHDIFDEVERTSKTEARWISASMKAMSLDHEPKSDFEKKAAKAIAAGTKHLEVIEDGYYRRATAIPLGSGCVSCHGGFSRKQSETPKFAGLVISLPIRSGDQAKPEKLHKKSAKATLP
jgi:hypothetical protein